uniref:Uncharacterized protein n=1 Tax=Solanum tuberosum TaxID=4113 RepID=M1DRD0_SOLTU
MGTTSENQCTKRDNNMEILVVPTVLQSDEDQVVRVHSESLNKALHGILIHKDVYSEPEDLTELKGVDCGTVSKSSKEQIYNDADISPRVMKIVKSDRNDKKHGDGESAQPLRVQPKRYVIS